METASTAATLQLTKQHYLSRCCFHCFQKWFMSSKKSVSISTVFSSNKLILLQQRGSFKTSTFLKKAAVREVGNRMLGNFTRDHSSSSLNPASLGKTSNDINTLEDNNNFQMLNNTLKFLK